MISDSNFNTNLDKLKEDFSLCLQFYQFGEYQKAEGYLAKCLEKIQELFYNRTSEQQQYIRFLLLKDVHSLCFTKNYNMYVS